jgi:hypothetical protein
VESAAAAGQQQLVEQEGQQEVEGLAALVVRVVVDQEITACLEH